jgi:hypothetical protein
MKRIVCIGIALLLLLAAAGCAPTNPAPTASPIVTAGVPSPEASILPATSPDNAGGTGTGGNAGGTGATIPNFAEGTEVTEGTYRRIKTALQEKYEGATIKRITHSCRVRRGLYVDTPRRTARRRPPISRGRRIRNCHGRRNGTSTANPRGRPLRGPRPPGDGDFPRSLISIGKKPRHTRRFFRPFFRD